MHITKTRLLVLGTMLASLMGCAGSDYSDLHTYINKVKAKPAGRIDPVPEFESYETFEYSADTYRDPFRQFERGAEVVEKQTDSTTALRPDQDRNKETLEAFPLDTLKFVGHLARGNEDWAIITSPDGLVHRVKVGNHLGTNYGEIVSINETKITIIEIIEDGMGGWIEREAALSLVE